MAPRAIAALSVAGALGTGAGTAAATKPEDGDVIEVVLIDVAFAAFGLSDGAEGVAATS